MYDVIVIGAGVVGSAVARELSRFDLKIGVLEKNLDVCNEQSGRNSAVIHGGFAYETGSNKARFCVEGCLGFEELAEELDIPYKMTGKVLVGNTEEDYESLQKTIDRGEKNGSIGLRMIDKKELNEILPAAVGEFAMLSPKSGIVDPFIYTIALAENAVDNGAEFFFDNKVEEIVRNKDNTFTVKTTSGEFSTKWVINCAGNNAGEVSNLLGIHGYEFSPTKGEYIVLDQKVGHLLPMPLYPVPSTKYMGIHVTPTIDGNVTVGPNANKVPDTKDYGVLKESIEFLSEDAFKLWPHIHKKDYIRTYAGIQSMWKQNSKEKNDFVIEVRDDKPNIINLVGIESPGLTCAVPIAREVVRKLKQKVELKEDENFNPIRKGIVKFSELSTEEQKELIKKNSDYGDVICRCEKVTRAEIIEAINNPLNVDTVTGIKYRTRAMLGRCQGGYCQMRITKLIRQVKNKKVDEIMYCRQGSQMFSKKVR